MVKRAGGARSLAIDDAGAEAPATIGAALDIATVHAPIAVAQLDLRRPEQIVELGAARDGGEYTAVAVLLRYDRTPVAWRLVERPASGTLSLDQLPAELRELTDSEPAGQTIQHGGAPSLSVVITTCADAPSTVSCVEQVLASRLLPSEVIVVDNRPDGSPVAAAIRRLDGTVPVRYVAERDPGLAIARNAGLAVARSDMVAFTDDDVTVDHNWTEALSRAFAADPEVDCVTGLILPKELDTEGQLDFERFTSLSKGLRPRSFSAAAPPADMPLFPYAAGHFGSGANSAFRREFLLKLGGFDPLLGAGTRTRGGEDLDVFIRLLSAGGKLNYEPAAIAWHHHPADGAGVDQRTFDYGLGLGAVIGKLLLDRQDRSRVLRLIPRAIGYWFAPHSRKNAGRAGRTRSPSVVARETSGVALGPLVYLRSWLMARAHAPRH